MNCQVCSLGVSSIACLHAFDPPCSSPLSRGDDDVGSEDPTYLWSELADAVFAVAVGADGGGLVLRVFALHF
jgi:hypothetical protein